MDHLVADRNKVGGYRFYFEEAGCIPRRIPL